MPKEYVMPEFNPAIMCPQCNENSEIFELYGILGGGEGPYTICADCGMIVTKSFACDSHKDNITDTTATEVPKEVEDGREGTATDKG